MDEPLEARIRRLEDVQQIRNLFSAHAYTNVTGDEYQRSYSHSAPDIRFEIERMGITDGQAAMAKRGPVVPVGQNNPGNAPPPNAGRMSTHYQTGYIIEVARDGKTAQAVCLSPGHVTGAGTTFGKFAPMWSFCRYGLDFVREADGAWKVWHEHIFTVFNSLYDKSWVTRSIANSLQPASGVDRVPRNAGRNTSIDAPFALNSAPRLVPHPPVAYATFNETQAYVPPPAPEDL